MDTLDANKDLTIRLVKDFFCAGSSALMVAFAQLHPEFQCLALLALVPFLWRATRVTCLEATSLGILLSVCHAFVTNPVSAWFAGAEPLYRLLGFMVAFGGYAVAVNKLARRIGFHAVFIAILWLPLEYALCHFGRAGRVFTLKAADSNLLFQVGSLCGTLMISFMVVLTNSVILVISGRVFNYTCFRTSGSVGDEDEHVIYLYVIEQFSEKPWIKFSVSRAPPLRPGLSVNYSILI